MGDNRFRVLAERAGGTEIHSSELGGKGSGEGYGRDVDAVTTEIEKSIEQTVGLEVLLVAGGEENAQRVVVERLVRLF